MQGESSRIKRSILREMLFKGLYLHRFAMKNQYIVTSTTHEHLIAKATSILSSLDIDEEILLELEVDADELVALGMVGGPWPKLVALKKGGDRGAEFVEEAMVFHMHLSTRMTTHLRLALENTVRTQWLAGGLLCPDAALAQESANALYGQLLRTPPKSRTLFEAAFISNEQFMLELDSFREQSPPVVLWGANARYSELFRCLAPRFLANPDTVLGCEGIHSRWQWLVKLRRASKLPFINGCLRLHYAMNDDIDHFPTVDTILPHFQALRLAEKTEYQLWLNEALPEQTHRCFMWASRFNLSIEEVQLLKQARSGSTDIQTKETAWANYCRQVLLSPWFCRCGRSIGRPLFVPAPSAQPVGLVRVQVPAGHPRARPQGPLWLLGAPVAPVIHKEMLIIDIPRHPSFVSRLFFVSHVEIGIPMLAA